MRLRDSIPTFYNPNHKQDVENKLWDEIDKITKNQLQNQHKSLNAKIGSAIFIVLLLTVVGWGGKKLYNQTFVVHEESVTIFPKNNETSFTAGTSITMVSKTDSAYTEKKAKEQYIELKNLISNGKGKLIRIDKLGSGENIYIYKFTLSDGEEMAFGTQSPLDNRSKLNWLKGENYEEIKLLIQQGKGELIDIEESETVGKIYVYQFTLSDESRIIYRTSEPIGNITTKTNDSLSN